MPQTEVKAIQRIKDMLEEYADCRDEMDSLKCAVEIYHLSREDARIADNMKSFWISRADG